MGHGNRENRHSRKMRKLDSLNRIASMSDATSNAPAQRRTERTGKQTAAASPRSPCRTAGREAGSYFHRDVIWECRLSVRWGYTEMTAYGVCYQPCGSYHLAGDGRRTSYRMRRSVFAASSRHARPARRHEGRHGRRGWATRRWAVRKTGRPLSSNRPVSYMVDHAGIQPATSGVQSRCSRD